MHDDMNEGNETPAVDETQAIAETLERLLRESDDRPQEGILTGFVACIEWMRPDGTYGFWRYNGDSLGNGLPPWRVNGILDYGKEGDFVDRDEDDEV